jgi:hypothetical protein
MGWTTTVAHQRSRQRHLSPLSSPHRRDRRPRKYWEVHETHQVHTGTRNRVRWLHTRYHVHSTPSRRHPSLPFRPLALTYRRPRTGARPPHRESRADQAGSAGKLASASPSTTTTTAPEEPGCTTLSTGTGGIAIDEGAPPLGATATRSRWPTANASSDQQPDGPREAGRSRALSKAFMGIGPRRCRPQWLSHGSLVDRVLPRMCRCTTDKWSRSRWRTTVGAA